MPAENWDSGTVFPAWDQTGIAVCATPGHGTYLASTGKEVQAGASQISTSCATESHVNSVGLWMFHRGKDGQLLRRLAIEPGGIMGTFESINLDQVTLNNAVGALCAMS